MFLLKLFRFLFRSKKRDVAYKHRPYALRNSHPVIKFLDPIDKKWAQKYKKLVTPQLIEERKQTFCVYDRKTIWDVIKAPGSVKEQPVFLN